MIFILLAFALALGISIAYIWNKNTDYGNKKTIDEHYEERK
jgi:hypothetical protein